ncbi:MULTISPECIES: caspase family protein [Rhodopseudomonas]|uniref:Peptidase C14 n=1 Tax=Rhodopseudomonas palustris TaxID=1076 RepID=A0A0D7F4F8_RHOPL|nr:MULTISPECIES: caspase family protein [Rhodopseudomonas]KIZ47999.1 peptidase C14 [Rhodopseudomonas palustris]MDF3813418.1 caspase family protein [Rhodopseudomonas sp. BAL398]WOK15970.1 caspase family protein [Rhodopseudomonas sp. BAL398]
MIKRWAQIAAMIGGTVLAVILSSSLALAEPKRVALVVGNSTYESVPQLPNPSRDAQSVAKLFEDAGYNVTLAIDVGNLEFKRAIRKFETDADDAEIAVLYYAGHGIEIGGTNYLIPVNARLISDRDADDEAIPLERMVSSADGAKKLRVVILDACRDNPFTVKMRRERKVASRGVHSGLGKIEPTSTDTLIAYAAKAGSTAEDGEGQHSPFTTAILKNLTVPGLDIRLAFGRVRDEVLKSTNNRQEPFVYGSLGGGNISLVPAPTVEKPVAADDDDSGIKADYNLVAKIGSRRAWEVFLGTYKTGFYADLARAQIASLNDQVPAPAAKQSGGVAVAAVAPNAIAPGREPTSKEALDWDRIKDSNDTKALQTFIARYPNSPLAITAKQRMDLLEKAAQEREAQARAAREAAARAAEEARIQAAQKKAEAAAARQRDEDERRAKQAEAEQKAKALEAERKAAEAKRKAEEAERSKAAAEAAALRAASEREARQAEEERRKAELASAQEAACKQQQSTFDALNAKGSEGTGLDDMKNFADTVSCERLRPQVAATLEKFQAEAAKRAAAMPNSPELVRSAQTELNRIGCDAGGVDGDLGPSTKGALGRYLAVKGKSSDDEVSVTEALVAELTGHSGRVCPLECKSGEIAKGDSCVAEEKKAPATASRRDRDDDDRRATRRRPSRQAERDRPRRQSRPEPRARQQAYSRPSTGRVGGSAMIGVGF